MVLPQPAVLGARLQVHGDLALRGQSAEGDSQGSPSHAVKHQSSAFYAVAAPIKQAQTVAVCICPDPHQLLKVSAGDSLVVSALEPPSSCTSALLQFSLLSITCRMHVRYWESGLACIGR